MFLNKTCFGKVHCFGFCIGGMPPRGASRTGNETGLLLYHFVSPVLARFTVITGLSCLYIYIYQKQSNMTIHRYPFHNLYIIIIVES